MAAMKIGDMIRIVSRYTHGFHEMSEHGDSSGGIIVSINEGSLGLVLEKISTDADDYESGFVKVMIEGNVVWVWGSHVEVVE